MRCALRDQTCHKKGFFQHYLLNMHAKRNLQEIKNISGLILPKKDVQENFSRGESKAPKIYCRKWGLWCNGAQSPYSHK